MRVRGLEGRSQLAGCLVGHSHTEAYVQGTDRPSLLASGGWESLTLLPPLVSHGYMLTGLPQIVGSPPQGETLRFCIRNLHNCRGQGLDPLSRVV